MAKLYKSILLSQYLIWGISCAYAGGETDENRGHTLTRLSITVPSNKVDYKGQNKIHVTMEDSANGATRYTVNLRENPTQILVDLGGRYLDVKKITPKERQGLPRGKIIHKYTVSEVDSLSLKDDVKASMEHKWKPKGDYREVEGDNFCAIEDTRTKLIEVSNQGPKLFSKNPRSVWLMLDRELKAASIKQFK